MPYNLVHVTRSALLERNNLYTSVSFSRGTQPNVYNFYCATSARIFFFYHPVSSGTFILLLSEPNWNKKIILNLKKYK